ncbi:MAG: restriction endonuclease [Bacilli bacterium]|nr:restriction endonuclease [Bacilli bacterium]
MGILFIVDNSLDEREFRNVSESYLEKYGFEYIRFDDERLSDNDPTNDNDILVKKDGVTYTVQTYLNKQITKKEIEETIEDMKNEKVYDGIIVTNKPVDDELKIYAESLFVKIYDQEIFK